MRKYIFCSGPVDILFSAFKFLFTDHQLFDLEVGLDRLEIKSLGFQFGGEQCLKSQSRFLITYDLGDNG